MTIYNISELASENKGEYVLGSADLHTHACYLVYGVLNPDEKGRMINPGKGHEEIVCLVYGEVMLRGESETFNLKPGQAVYLKGNGEFFMDNKGRDDAIYVISGGHSEGHHH